MLTPVGVGMRRKHRNASPRLRGAFRGSLFLKCVMTGFERVLGFEGAPLLTVFWVGSTTAGLTGR